MPTALSVNLNKIALVRNSRSTTIPDPVRAARICIEAGCQGITLHPRPDQRHVRPDDVERIAQCLLDHPDIEYNLEGNPDAQAQPNGYPGWMALVQRFSPHQATLVPDNPSQLTSDHGFDIDASAEALAPVVSSLKAWGVRVSIFVDGDPNQNFERARTLGVDRVELYTGPYAEAHAKGGTALEEVVRAYAATARAARDAGLGINAGHDLNLSNLTRFLSGVPGVDEVSIGHALITDALEMGLDAAVRSYLAAIDAAR